MKLKGLIKALIITMAFVLSFAGCTGQTDNNPSESPEASADHRQPLVEEKTDYKDEDGKFDYKTEEWNGPEDYVIVVPDGNAANKKTAELLKSYYKDALDISVSVVTDKTAEGDKEILIGKTSRSDSNKEIAEADLSVSVKNGKLVFDGGHDVTVDSAVKKYIRLAPKANETHSFDITTDFKSTLPENYDDKGNYEGYEYVWGDEFEGNGVDMTKWSFIAKMAGNEQVEVSTDKNVIDVADGRLKLTALSYFNNNREGTEYRVPCSVVTEDKMNYTYGYLEIRSRIPYKKGCFPSWWTQATDRLKGKGTTSKTMLEVDMYEIFNSFQKTSNLIHWWTDEEGNTQGPAYYPNVNENPQAYVFEDTPSLPYEYHVYGYYWSPTEIFMTIDGKMHTYFDITVPWCEGTGDDLSMYKDPQHVIFNNHLFYPGVSTASQSISTAPESLPGEHYIDYIRLYQKPGEGELYLAK